MGAVSTCWGVPMAVLIPELLHSLAFHTDAPACLSPLVCPGTQPWSVSAVGKGPRIWVVGGERGCTLGPLGETWSGSFTLHSELQVKVRREGVLTRTSPLMRRNLGGPRGTQPAA